MHPRFPIQRCVINSPVMRFPTLCSSRVKEVGLPTLRADLLSRAPLCQRLLRPTDCCALALSNYSTRKPKIREPYLRGNVRPSLPIKQCESWPNSDTTAESP